MKYKLTINCTKEHLMKSLMCGTPELSTISENCWIAVAVQQVFPGCNVENTTIANNNRYLIGQDEEYWTIYLPNEATINIYRFDATDANSPERMALEPFSFDIEIDQPTLETIMRCNGFKSMQAFSDVIFKTPHLELEEVNPRKIQHQ